MITKTLRAGRRVKMLSIHSRPSKNGKNPELRSPEFSPDQREFGNTDLLDAFLRLHILGRLGFREFGL